MEAIFGMCGMPIQEKGVYLFCHDLFPNSEPKKIAIPFLDEDGEGYDVFEFEEEVNYINIKGQYPTSVGPALIKDMETIYPIIDKAKIYSENIRHRQYGRNG